MSSKRSIQTINAILEELKNNLPSFKEGMVFETLETIFPQDKGILNEESVVEYQGNSFTKPLAVNRKEKEKYFKEESPVSDFFEERTRGDFLRVVKINNKGEALCENLSIKKDIREQFYDYIPINEEDLAKGKVKIYKRNIKKFFS